jgi:three-Cys-motif partner protein
MGGTKPTDPKVDEIGYWSELKLEIIGKYARAYSTIIARQSRLSHIYIDGFCGSGQHVSRTTGDKVPGSPVVVLNIDPPFEEYHFIDLDRNKTDTLRRLIEASKAKHYERDSVYIYEADCNEVLLKDVLPRAKYRDFRRALCLLDPYGLHLSWEVIAKAGAMKSVEIFLNFPIGDMNRNVLRRDTKKVTSDQAARLTRYWGDDSWKQAAYSSDGNLFEYEEKASNEIIISAFRKRLKEAAGFSFVPEPIPMRNRRGSVIYYLFFASPNNTGARIVKDIFSRYRDRRS